MARAGTVSRKATWPIVYGPRPNLTSEPSPRLAWALFVVLGLPFALMTILVVLADAGIRIPLFGILWMPFPPEVLKPFLGLAVFAATLAYLAYRVGHRAGFHTGTGIGLAAARNLAEARMQEAPPAQAPESAASPPPPPPPEPALDANVDEP